MPSEKKILQGGAAQTEGAPIQESTKNSDVLLREQVASELRTPEPVPYNPTPLEMLIRPSNNIDSVVAPGGPADTAEKALGQITVSDSQTAANNLLGSFLDHIKANRAVGEVQMAKAAVANEVVYGDKTFESVKPELDRLTALEEDGAKKSEALKAHITKFAYPLGMAVDAVGFTAQSFPLSVDILKGGLNTGAVTGGAAVGGAIATGGVGSFSIPIAAELGFQTGIFAESMKVNGALDYLSYREIGFSHEEATAMSISSGTINGALDAISFGLLTGVAKRPFLRFISGAKLNRVARSAAAALVASSAIEGTQEALQNLVTDGVRIAGALFKEDITKLPSVDEVWKGAMQNFYAGFGAGFITGGAVHAGGLTLKAGTNVYQAKVKAELEGKTLTDVTKARLDKIVEDLKEFKDGIQGASIEKLNGAQKVLNGYVSKVSNAVDMSNLAFAAEPKGEMTPTGKRGGSGPSGNSNTTGGTARSVIDSVVKVLNDVINAFANAVKSFYSHLKNFDNLSDAEKERIQTDFKAAVEHKLHQTPVIGSITKAMRVTKMMLEGYIDKKLEEDSQPRRGDIELDGYDEVFVPASEMSADVLDGVKEQHRAVLDNIQAQTDLYKNSILVGIQSGPLPVDLSQSNPDTGSLRTGNGKQLQDSTFVPERKDLVAKGAVQKFGENWLNGLVTGQLNYRGVIGQVFQDVESRSLQAYEYITDKFDLNRFGQKFIANKRVAYQKFYDEIQKATGLSYPEVVAYMNSISKGRKIIFEYVGVNIKDPVTGERRPIRTGDTVADRGLSIRTESLTKGQIVSVWADLESEGVVADSVLRSNGFTTPGTMAKEGITLPPGKKTYLEGLAEHMTDLDKAYVQGIRNFMEKYHSRLASYARLYDGVEVGFVPGYVGQVRRKGLDPLSTFDQDAVGKELGSSGTIEDLLLGPFVNEGVTLNGNVFAKAEPAFTKAKNEMATREYKAQNIVPRTSQYIEESERYITYRPVSRAMFSAINSDAVQTALKTRFGDGPTIFGSVYKALHFHLASIFLGRNRALRKDSVKLIEERLSRELGIALIGGNIFSAIKQRASVLNVLHFLGLRDSIRLNEVYNSNMDVLQRMWDQYVPFINRSSNFAESQVAVGIAREPAHLRQEPLIGFYFGAVRGGDRAATYRVASLVYLKHLEDAGYYKEGTTEEQKAQINEEAKWKGFDAANSTQSTSDVDLRSGISLQYPALGFAQQQPQALGQRAYESFRRYANNPTEENLKHLAKTVMVNNASQALFNSVNTAYALVVFGEDSEEYKKARDNNILSTMAGPAPGVWNALNPFIWLLPAKVAGAKKAKPFDIVPVTGSSIQRALDSAVQLTTQLTKDDIKEVKIDLLGIAETLFKATYPAARATPLGKYLPPISAGAATSAMGDIAKAEERKKKEAEEAWKKEAPEILDGINKVLRQLDE